MNLPGLDTSWILGHRALRGLGIIRPWTLDQCRAALGEGAPVLVVATTALGDSILCTPLLDTLSTALGPRRTLFWVREPFRTLYSADPRIGAVFGARGKYRGLGVARREMRAAMGFDVHPQKAEAGFGDTQSLSASPLPPPPGFIALIANCSEPDVIPWLWWCGARGFLRYRSRWSTWAPWFANRPEMREPHEDSYATGHAISNNLAMAQSLGLTPSTERLGIRLAPQPEETTSASPPLIVIHPGASRADKCWPLERWAEVARGLHQHALDHGNPAPRFIITGGGGEREAADKLCKLLPAGTAESRAGSLGLPALAALQQQAALFLSGDTGPYHLAVSVNCPTVTLFAPRDRGSSTEACGLHHADRARHSQIETANYGDPITEITVIQVLSEALKIVASR